MPTQVHIYNTQSVTPIDPLSVEQVVHFSLELQQASCDEVTIHFVEETEICELHDQFFNDPSPTDCITLPIDSPNTEPHCVLGEVFVSPQAALNYVEHSDRNPYEEITLYVVHGILHLLGYEDIEEEDKQAMRAAETHVMTALKSANLLVTSP